MGPDMPINYIIGNPSSATVDITSGTVTNIPPVVDIVYPPEGAVFYTPVSIPIVACARDVDGLVKSVEFFADDVSLGVVTNPVSILPALDGPVPPLPPMPPYRPFVLVWSNASVGSHTLTAKATDNGGASTLSDPVHITVNPGPPPPPTNFPPVVRIISPPNNSVFREPINLPIYAYAADKDGWVTGVEFFAGTNDLGRGPPRHPALRRCRPARFTVIPFVPDQLLAVDLEQRPARHLSAHGCGDRQSRRLDRFRRGQRHHPAGAAAARHHQRRQHLRDRPDRHRRAPTAGWYLGLAACSSTWDNYNAATAVYSNFFFFFFACCFVQTYCSSDRRSPPLVRVAACGPDQSRRRARRHRDEKHADGRNAPAVWARPIPSGGRPVRAGRVASWTASPSIFATLWASIPRISQAWIKLVSTSRHTAMSMVALISTGPDGSVFAASSPARRKGQTCSSHSCR